METNALLKKIKQIEIKTKGLTKHVFSGEYHSAFKGKGMAFSEVRNYHAGDEVRTIDWNVTARFNEPFVKVFEEERELNVLILLDVSGSFLFGSGEQSKKELALELVAVIAFSAEANNDKVGVIFVSDRVEKYIPPAKGRKHMLRILREIIEFKPQSETTHLLEGLKYFNRVVQKRSIAFVISDFKDENDFSSGFNISRRKHDVVALQLLDKNEAELPDLGLIQLFNAESKQTTWVDSSNPTVRAQFKNQQLNAKKQIQQTFQKMGIDHISIQTSEDYIPQLVHLFKKRG
jgi:uncharacterized protein (DUF58 family)